MDLNEAQRQREAAFKSAKESLAFAAPEMFGLHFSTLESRIQSIIDGCFEGEPDSQDEEQLR